MWPPDQYARVEEQWKASPTSEWEPYWEYGNFVDVRDVATAVGAALNLALEGHHRALLCADDIAASAPSLELAQRVLPSVPIRDRARYEADPWRALIDNSVAARLLSWQPRYRWSDRGEPR